jgi:hypothetical protein
MRHHPLTLFSVDYNSWQETPESKKALKNLDRDFILAEGYKTKIDTKRKHMARMGNWRNNRDEEIQLDGVGGVSIMVKADVHRSGEYYRMSRLNIMILTSHFTGINFPCYPFENQAETEGFAKMAKRAGYGVYGLPNYVVWHIDTDEKSKHN